MQVTVSSRGQIAIPEKIRESLGIRPSQKLEAIQYGGHIELVPPATRSAGGPPEPAGREGGEAPPE